MITRIFTARVPDHLHDEFRAKFIEISVPLVASFEGLRKVDIAGPSQSNPAEFVMISVWEDVRSVENFAGAKWNKAHIPAGMKKYITDCHVAHYENIDIS